MTPENRLPFPIPADQKSKYSLLSDYYRKLHRPPAPPQEMEMFRVKRDRSGPLRRSRHDLLASYVIVSNVTGEVVAQVSGRLQAQRTCKKLNIAARAHTEEPE